MRINKKRENVPSLFFCIKILLKINKKIYKYLVKIEFIDIIYKKEIKE